MKKGLIAIPAIALFSLTACKIIIVEPYVDDSYKYGILLGIIEDDVVETYSYDRVAIDLEDFPTKIKEIKARRIKVDAHLPIGLLNSSLDYSVDYKENTLAPSEDFIGKYWMDVTNEDWHDKIIELATEYKENGADGLYLDDLDVYSIITTLDREDKESYQKSVYSSLTNLIMELNDMELDITIKGADELVEQMFNKDYALLKTIDYYVAECSFTSITDYDNDIFNVNPNKDIRLQFVEKVSLPIPNIVLLEYTTDGDVIDEILDYAKNHSFSTYIATSTLLD